MNSSARTLPGSGITPFSRLAAASLNATSATFSENVENAFSAVATSGCGMSGDAAGLGGFKAALATTFVCAANDTPLSVIEYLTGASDVLAMASSKSARRTLTSGRSILTLMEFKSVGESAG